MPARFGHRLEAPLPDWKAMLRILREGGFSGGKPAPEDVARVRRVPDGTRLPPASEGGTSVTWIGHATTLIRVAGRTFVTDPVWSTRIPGGLTRTTPPGLAFEDAGPVDGILVSHNHYDHLDAPTLKRYPRDTPVYAPLGLGAWFRKRGFTRVTERDWWESVSVDGVDVTLVPAQHWSRRGPFDTTASLWGGWVVRRSGARSGGVWFAGDTGYNAAYFTRIGHAFPDLDVAVIPIGAYEPRWFMKPLHQNPEEAVQCFKDAGAQRFVPMHWGTFVLTREPLLDPLERLHAAWDAEKLARDALWDLALGETRTVTHS